MAVDRTRYRQTSFIGARILQARELNWLQEMAQDVAVTDNETPVSGRQAAIYRQGATMNITVNTSGLVVTLSPTNITLPMKIFVRDRWENFPGPGNNDDCTDTISTFPGNHSMTLGASDTTIYLNWELRIRTGGLTGDDPTLTDATTNQAVASMGELILHLSRIDTSGVALGGNQLAKNITPIPLFTFINTGTVLTYTPIDNVLTAAQGSSITSGLVRTTTNNATVVSTDDTRMTNPRSALDGSVHDSSVRVPIAAGGTNADGTATYNLTGDIGGISAAKIVYTAGTQLLSDFAGWIKTQFNNLLARYNAHETAVLGLSNTHPVPTASQVGAAPLSHVGLNLGLVTSHPPIINQNSAGFQVNRSGGGGAVDDPAYGVFVSGGSIVGLNHDGDVYSSKSAAFTATPGGILASGPLAHISLIAQVLSQHVNQVSHANPHGLSAGDLGAATTSYVDNAVANVLANAENYTNTIVPGMSIHGASTAQSTSWAVFRFAPNNGNAIEVLVGFINVSDGTTILLPSVISGTPWSAASSILIPSVASVFNGQHGLQGITCTATNTSGNWVVSCNFRDNSGNFWTGNANCLLIGWRQGA